MTLWQVHEIGEAVLKLERAFLTSDKSYKAAVCHLATA